MEFIAPNQNELSPNGIDGATPLHRHAAQYEIYQAEQDAMARLSGTVSLEQMQEQKREIEEKLNKQFFGDGMLPRQANITGKAEISDLIMVDAGNSPSGVDATMAGEDSVVHGFSLIGYVVTGRDDKLDIVYKAALKCEDRSSIDFDNKDNDNLCQYFIPSDITEFTYAEQPYYARTMNAIFDEAQNQLDAIRSSAGYLSYSSEERHSQLEDHSLHILRTFRRLIPTEQAFDVETTFYYSFDEEGYSAINLIDQHYKADTSAGSTPTTLRGSHAEYELPIMLQRDLQEKSIEYFEETGIIINPYEPCLSIYDEVLQVGYYIPRSAIRSIS